MRERPILMTPENAQKVFEGVKTQTRRLNGLDEVNSSKLWGYPQMQDSGIAVFLDSTQANPYNNALDVKCPYGLVGDRLWCRENGWERPYRTERMLREGADTWEPFYYDALLDIGEAEELKQLGFKRRPSIHMPRWACRTVVEVTEIRVERVQDISEEDAKAEGCEPHAPSGRDGKVYRRPFECLWESINGKYSWDSNPWVWVIEFKKI